ncbi:unnamed protein product [Nezara viridula]|uniref:Uncharacterized protein n=1 Tax=Nezara viridula TaxID=85310 RepID=A0A9P0HPK9_NEZVI|nr:unnamed protein product [Nezara viridula]
MTSIQLKITEQQSSRLVIVAKNSWDSLCVVVTGLFQISQVVVLSQNNFQG